MKRSHKAHKRKGCRIISAVKAVTKGALWSQTKAQAQDWKVGSFPRVSPRSLIILIQVYEVLF